MKSVEKKQFDVKQLQDTAQTILQEAARCGADQAEVSIEANKGFSVSAHDRDVETVEYNQDKIIEVAVFFGKRIGSASVTDIRPQALRAAVEAACHIAKFTDEDEASGLADKADLAFHFPQIDCAYPWPITVEKAIELACQCEREALAYDKRIMVAEEVRVATLENLSIYANSFGFMGFYPTSQHDISCVLVAKEGDEMQRDYSYSLVVDPSQLESISTIAKNAVQRTVQRLGSRRIATTKAPVIFAAETARNLLGYFVSAIQGPSLYRQSSFLLDQLNKQIFPTFVHIKEQPHLTRALGSAPFDDEGVATRANTFIEAGILRSYSLDVYSARKLKLHTTGNAGGVHNLVITPGKKDLKQLIKDVDRGLLVTELMGQGVNLVTGDYSRGATGYWIENGEIQYPVSEITIAGNLKDIYKRLVEVGNDVDTRGNVRTGSLLIEEMTIAGN